jgi:hypothetical protein
MELLGGQGQGRVGPDGPGIVGSAAGDVHQAGQFVWASCWQELTQSVEPTHKGWSEDPVHDGVPLLLPGGGAVPALRGLRNGERFRDGLGEQRLGPRNCPLDQ